MSIIYETIKYPYRLKCLTEGWGFSAPIIEAVYQYFQESFDKTDDYLRLMATYKCKTPIEGWQYYCKENEIEYKEDKNPFIR